MNEEFRVTDDYSFANQYQGVTFGSTTGLSNDSVISI